MRIKARSLVRVVTDYHAQFPDPIRVRSGDVISIDPGKKTSIAGWVWCTSQAGKSGWVPDSYLNRQGTTGRMRCDYDAIELTVNAGEILTVLKMESDFYWVTDRSGRQGWVPVAQVEPYPCTHDLEEK
jgi:uncharacterized protein YgiM (DUF1202 family)